MNKRCSFSNIWTLYWLVFMISIIGVVLILILPFAHSISKQQYCSGWNNLTFDDCDLLWLKFNEKLNYSYLNQKNNFSVTVKSPDVKIYYNTSNEQINNIINLRLIENKNYVDTKLSEYKSFYENLIISDLKNQVNYLKLKNISILATFPDFSSDSFVKKNDFETVLIRLRDLENINDSKDQKNNGIDFNYILIGIVGLVVIYFFYNKQKQDKLALLMTTPRSYSVQSPVSVPIPSNNEVKTNATAYKPF